MSGARDQVLFDRRDALSDLGHHLAGDDGRLAGRNPILGTDDHHGTRQPAKPLLHLWLLGHGSEVLAYGRFGRSSAERRRLTTEVVFEVSLHPGAPVRGWERRQCAPEP